MRVVRQGGDWRPIEAASLFAVRLFQKFDVAVGLIGQSVPTKGHLSQQGLFKLIFRLQSQFMAFGRQYPAIIRLLSDA
jgi:hypothetical protein